MNAFNTGVLTDILLGAIPKDTELPMKE